MRVARWECHSGGAGVTVGASQRRCHGEGVTGRASLCKLAFLHVAGPHKQEVTLSRDWAPGPGSREQAGAVVARGDPRLRTCPRAPIRPVLATPGVCRGTRLSVTCAPGTNSPVPPNFIWFRKVQRSIFFSVRGARFWRQVPSPSTRSTLAPATLVTSTPAHAVEMQGTSQVCPV